MAILKGNNLKNILNGSAGDDILLGYGNNDILNAGVGNDILKGGEGADILIGAAGNDVLNGGSDADVLLGGDGNDIYVVDHVNDVLFEAVAEGIDTVKSSISWVLGENVENLTLTGAAKIGGGNALNNTLKGNNANNELYGGDGNDTLAGGLGFDTLYGGAGNDSLRISDLGLDTIDGGTGTDSLQIDTDNTTLDLSYAPIIARIKNIEVFRLGDSHATLTVDAQSIIHLSNDSDSLKVDASGNSNTLQMDTGWTDEGILSGYHTFTKDGATLQVNTIITGIQVIDPIAHTLSDLATAATVSTLFDSGTQEITLDFGGKPYKDWGLSSIDLSGFGLEDKLIIARHDGALSKGNVSYSTVIARSRYISEYFSHIGTHTSILLTDRVSWQAGASKAKLISNRSFGSSGEPTTLGGTSGTFQHTVGQIALMGLPAGLPDSHFVFV